MSKTVSAWVDRVGNQQILLKTVEATRKLWLGGLGAYSLAARSSVRAVETLLRESKAMPPKARQQIEEKSAELMSTANTAIQRGEQVVRERFLRPLDFVLLATRRDIEQLSLRVIELSTEVHQLATGKATPATKPAERDDSPMIAGTA
ncbi:phasin family protein [Candidatus Accumulibacter vicinus]|uniref:Poly(Hydroxyalkanoate) granule-associated protein n=1 Tax=Candidatus Accumulibacter vicinus TaxID=2954382 RepID=A0A084Y478_9PROT|nr:phasin family protein [Candidatus Accumulibacter vicinus]KFB69522.1 MAG: poly(hydroxyalkanoate) granule-associated protein [Candidatus Accumulibacter vicinus]